MSLEQLRTLREKSTFSQKKLADELGVSRNLVHKWETGSSSPDPDTLKKIACLFNVSVDYLIGNTNVSKIVKSQLPAEMQGIITESEGISPEGLGEIRKYAQLVKIKEQVDRNSEAEASLGHAKSG
jgi:transcriptional regulator with XRE-family HTH domain